MGETESDPDLQSEGPDEDDASTGQREDTKQRLAGYTDALAAGGREHQENLRRIARAVAAILISAQDQLATPANQSGAEEQLRLRRPGGRGE